MFRKRTTRERFWEILPGLAVWVVFFGSITLSYYKPIWAAVFIVCFDLYWVLKAINTSIHLLASYRKFRVLVTIDWLDFVHRLADFRQFAALLSERASYTQKGLERNYYKEEIKRLNNWLALGRTGADFSGYFQLVVLPFVDENFSILDSTLSALDQVAYPHERMMVLLATEGRVGAMAQQVALQIAEKYSARFFKVFISEHPDGLADEIRGKSANASYAVEHVLPELEQLNIPIDRVVVSNFDSDTVVHPQYFARVMYEFLTADKPYQKSYQPIAIYNNNIWDSPSFIRVVSVSNSFWQFTESSRPDRLRTFSSHSMALRTLVEVSFWRRDIINEDGFIFWQCYLHFDGDYQVVPLFIPVSLDTCLADSFWETLKNQYRQKRRWAYNVEYYPHLVPRLLNSRAPFWDRMYKLWQYVEGDFNWAAASILISSLGWLPLIVGGAEFQQSVVAFNLPQATRVLMTIATVFLIFSVYINLILLPPRPKKYSVGRTIMMYLQWFLVPITSVVFGSLPAVEAQTRLMFGRYLEFWVTPKTRLTENTALNMKEMQSVKQRP